MNLEIHGLTGCLFVDIFLLWLFVSVIMCFGIFFFGFLFVPDITTIDNKKIINKIMKLKNDDRHLYRFAKKLDDDNIKFLENYNKRFIRVIYTSTMAKLERKFINNNDKKLFYKIDSIIYYYNLIKEK